jgi:PAS domain S-box-containing protein
MKNQLEDTRTDDVTQLQRDNARLREENNTLREELAALRAAHQSGLVDHEVQLANEKRYEESQVRFRTIFEQSRLGNKIIASDLRIIRVNKALEQMLGYSEHELIGTKITDCAHPDSVKHWQELQDKLWKHELPSFHIEVKMVRKDGSTLWCSVTTILFEDNQTTLGYSILEDIAERRELEEKLASSESMLAQSQQAAGVGSFIADLGTGMVECSPVLNRIFGFPEGEERIHRDVFFGVIDAASRERHQKVLAKAIARVSAYTSEYKITVAGREKWIWEKGEVRKDAEGRLKLLGAVQANDSQTLQLLLGIINGTTTTVTVAKPVRDERGTIVDFRYVLFNNTAKRYLGASDEDSYMIGKTLTELFPATRHNGNLERYIDTIENNKSYKGVEYFYPYDGMNHWFSEAAYCFGDYIVVTLEDITDRKQREAKLRNLEALLLQSEKIANIGAFDWSADVTGGTGSPQLYKILGFDMPEPFVIGDFLELMHPEDVSRTTQYIANWVKTGGVFETEYRIMRKNDGVLRHVWVRGDLVAGRLMGYLMDITERVEMERSHKKLALRNDELDNFVYTASHDLRAPLNNMGVLVEYLAEEMPSAQGNAKGQLYLNTLTKCIADLKNTLEDLTTVTEIHPGEKKELVELKSVVEEVQGSLSEQIKEAGAQVKVDLTVPFLTIPKKHARSLVFNMLSNALKFRSPERKPVITITSALEKDKTRLSFADNGIGIRAVNLPKVFMIFKRFNPEVAGRGVGMYLVKRVVDLNGGDIYVESKENVGTTFHVEFPIENF